MVLGETTANGRSGSSATRTFTVAAGPVAYVADQGDGTVSVIDVASGTVTSTIPVRPSGLVSVLGSDPKGVAFAPDGRTGYVVDDVPNYTTGYVAAIDVASGTVRATIAVGASPVGVAIR